MGIASGGQLLLVERGGVAALGSTGFRVSSGALLDPTRLVSFAGDHVAIPESRRILLLDTTTGAVETLKDADAFGRFFAAASSQDYVAAASALGDNGVSVFDRRSGEVLWRQSTRKRAGFGRMAWGGRFLVIAGSNAEVFLYEGQTGVVVETRELPISGWTRAVGISKDAGCVALSTSEREVCLWIREPQEFVRVPAGGGVQVTSLGFSEDGSLLVTGSAKGLLEVFDLLGRPLLSFSEKVEVAFSEEVGDGTRRVRSIACREGRVFWAIRNRVYAADLPTTTR